MFQITSDYQSDNISDWCIFQIGFRLVSDWFQTGFRLVSDWFQIGTKNFRLRLQISDFFRLLQIHFRLAFQKKIQTGSLKKNFRL